MNFYNEAGQLTEEGRKVTQPLVEMINNLVAIGKTPSEKRLIGSIITGLVGNITTNQIIK